MSSNAQLGMLLRLETLSSPLVDRSSPPSPPQVREVAAPWAQVGCLKDYM